MGLRELHRVNRNVIPISKVVGASSGVPGVFPPTVIYGDRLVDGGVSDNQGTDALIEEFSGQEGNPAKDKPHRRAEVLLVSDASGQMEPVHRVRRRTLSVLTRASSVLQFQLRKKTVGHLQAWEDKDTASKREFAFVHLLLNLKDREKASQDGQETQGRTNGSGHNGPVPRVPTEYIAPLSKIRTDLDQFNPIERECLMYHGYTLIDAQIRKYCCELKKQITKSKEGGWPAYRKPALFREGPEDRKEVEPYAGESRQRQRVQEVLRLGRESFFLIRSIKRHWDKHLVSCVLNSMPLLTVLIGAGGYALYRLFWAVGGVAQGLCELTGRCDATSAKSIWIEICILIGDLVGAGIPVVVLFYIVLFATFEGMRDLAKWWDAHDYRDLTSEHPGVRWYPDPHRGERDGG